MPIWVTHSMMGALRCELMAAGFALVLANAAQAAEPGPADAPADVVRYRQLTMRAMAAHLKALSPLAAQKVSLPAHVSLHVRALADAAKIVTELFPKGTSTTQVPETEALDAVWKNGQGFATAARDFSTEAGKLAAAAAKGDLGALRAQIDLTNDSCAACHKHFRAEK